MAKYEIINGAAIFPEGITVIDREAFRDCEELTSVTIPQSVTEIRGSAFYCCKGLTDVVIPKGVTSIGLEAFAGCSNLRSIVVEEGNPNYESPNNCNAIIAKASDRFPVTLVVGCCNTVIPDGVEVIGPYAFSYCKDLISINIPESVKTIAKCAFFDCSGLTGIKIPKSVVQIDETDVFGNCNSLASIVVEEGNPIYDSRDNCNAIIEKGTTLILGCCNSIIPVGVTTIGRSAFSGSALTNVTLPEGVKTIEEYAFSKCSSLSEVLIPDTVEEIGTSAFKDSGLTTVVIPEKVRNLHGTFLRCNNLKSAIVKGKLEDYRTDCTFPFMDCPSLETLTFIDCVRYIKEESCNGCKSLKTIYVPAKKGDYYKKRFAEELHPIIVELEPVKKVKK